MVPFCYLVFGDLIGLEAIMFSFGDKDVLEDGTALT